MAKLTDFKVLSFDCYGTLIDWETGICAALAAWRKREELQVSDQELIESFGRNERVQEQETPELLYPEILSRVLKRMAAGWSVRTSDADAMAFGLSIRHWPAFVDSAPALKYLKQHYQLVILSNVDCESFSHSNTKLGVEFDHIFTAQDIGSYKPDPRNFSFMLERLSAAGIEKTQILHTAESLYHDHIPAKKLGLVTNWINRRHALKGFGATRPPTEEVKPDFRFDSVAEFADAHRVALQMPAT
ncbi:MAG TPA: haloacid dehalogenase type II [Gammaproteobacteria bacterium]|nr:haloacid dehalogenase type II [Gammaproteobacteria bacterium]